MDYQVGYMEITEIVALCHLCHTFIHSGRLAAIIGSEQMPFEKAEYILKRGFKVLKENNLTPFYGTARVYANLFDETAWPRVERLTRDQAPDNIQQDWTKWYLILDGEKHFSKFKSQFDWEKHYDGR